ncbi:MAG: oligopeptide ABC transporter ATP-binding protein, partial [bacterium]|nr:oligopeptide ABC transporter ATP-binding protein [bacterium]
GQYNDVFGETLHPYTKALLSAVPVPDPKFRRLEPIPKDEIPDAINPPSGCHFHPRCPYAEKRCSEEAPTLTDRGNGHLVSCWLHEK